MRIEPFTMERDILQVGDEVEVTESRLPRAWYYTAEPAAAMSGNYAPADRILSRRGIIRTKELIGATWTVYIEFDE